MKKQIFTFTLFVMAILAGISQSYAQTSYTNYLSDAPDCVASVQLGCYQTPDELHPEAGQTYTYSVTVSDPGNDKIHWFVTTETNIITALNNLTTTVDPVNGSYVLAAGSAYNDAANTANSVDISWKSFNPSQVVLLVTYVTNSAGCTDNIEVYRIQPVFNFTLDMAALDAAGDLDPSATDCVSPVESAIYDAAANSGAGGMVVDYGENWVYFSVNAANFSHSWMPTFQVSYTGGVSDPIELQWAYPSDATANSTWHTTTGSAGTFTSADAVVAQDASGAVGTGGECIVVRVRVDHGTNENSTANQTLSVAVNGTMYDQVAGNYTNATLDDLGEDTDSDGNCDAVDFDDSVNYTLTPRPDVTSATGTGPLNFIQKN